MLKTRLLQLLMVGGVVASLGFAAASVAVAQASAPLVMGIAAAFVALAVGLGMCLFLFRDKPAALAQSLACGAALTVGFVFTGWIFTLRSAPEQAVPEDPGPLVEVWRAQSSSAPVEVVGFAEVRPYRQVSLAPQVGGRVTWVADALVTGGYFDDQAPLLRIDRSDHELALRRAEAEAARTKAEAQARDADLREAEAALADARLELDRVEELFAARSATSRERERTRLAHERAAARVDALEAQRAQSRAMLAVSQVAVEQAELSLDRTELRAPFAGRVSSESVQVGSLVNAGQVVAELYGTDVMEVVTPLETRELAWFDLPGPPGEGEAVDGARARLLYDHGGRRWERFGFVARTEGEVDPRTRLVSVVVKTLDSLGPASLASSASDIASASLSRSTSSHAPLTPGAFVEVRIAGRPLEGVFALPRTAIRPGGIVWLARSGRLHFQPVEVAWRDDQHAYVSRGLAADDLVVLTLLETPTQGMVIRTSEVVADDAASEAVASTAGTRLGPAPPTAD